MTRFASFDDRERRRGGSALVTGTEVTPQQGGASCVVTTDSESPRLLRLQRVDEDVGAQFDRLHMAVLPQQPR